MNITKCEHKCTEMFMDSECIAYKFGSMNIVHKGSLTFRRACLEIVRTRNSCQSWRCRRVKIKSAGKYVEST
jgi:hypothetical protein